jgi:tetratricopeptide (TPR) repeat protein
LGVLFSVLISGCSSLGITPRISSLPQEIPRKSELVETPFFPQQQNHCGPAALATLLQHRRITVSPESLSRLTYLPKLKGSLQIELTATARQHEVVVYPLSGTLNDLLREIAAGNPVLILQNLAFSWFPRWHYAVVIGYDLEREWVIMRSGREQRWITAFPTFMNTWNRADNWAIVTLPPGVLPATAETSIYLKAVNDLEETGQDLAANRSYRAAVQAWPESMTAWLALGNSAYGVEDWPLAVSALRKATELAPNNATAWNNLAYALLADGQKEPALAAVQRALSISPNDPNLLHSERDIKRKVKKR